KEQAGFVIERRGVRARRIACALLVAVGATLGSRAVRGEWRFPLERVKLPPGFQISLYARVPGARSMALSPSGTLFVGTRDTSAYAVRTSPGREPTVYTIARGMRMPNGVALPDRSLYLAEVHRVLRYDGIA